MTTTTTIKKKNKEEEEACSVRYLQHCQENTNRKLKQRIISYAYFQLQVDLFFRFQDSERQEREREIKKMGKKCNMIILNVEKLSL